MADDPDAGVRRELILDLRDAPTVKAGDLLLKLASKWDGVDRFYLEALGLAIEKRESAFIHKLLNASLFGDLDLERSGKIQGLALPPYFPADRNEAYIAIGAQELPASALSKTIGLLWRLHAAEGLELLSKILPAIEAEDLRQAADEVVLRTSDPAGAKLLAKLAAGATDPIRKRELLTLLAKKLQGDWQSVKGDDAIVSLVESVLSDPRTIREGVALSAGESRYLNKLAAYIKDAKLAEDLRVAAIDVVGTVPTPEARALLIGSIESAKDQKVSPPEASAALRALNRRGGERSLLLEVEGSQAYPLGLRKEALRMLAERREDASELIKSAREGKLPGELKDYASVVLNSHPDGSVREEAAKALPLDKKAGRNLPPIDQILRRRGDAEHGRAVFFAAHGSAAACASCHRVQGEGRWIGPDLSTIGVKYGKDELLRSILSPSAAVGYNFRTLLIADKDGRTTSGLLVEESPEKIVLKTSEGVFVPIPTANIEEKSYSDASLMPEGLAQAMNDRDLVDLLAYLSTLKEPATVIGRYQVLGPVVEAEGKLVVAPSDALDLSSKVKDARGRTSTWRTAAANIEGVLDATPLLESTDASPTAVYLAVPFTSPTAQRGKLVLEVPSGARAWLGGRELELGKVEKDKPVTLPIELSKGSGSLLVRLTGAKGRAAATFITKQPVEPK